MPQAPLIIRRASYKEALEGRDEAVPEVCLPRDTRSAYSQSLITTSEASEIMRISARSSCAFLTADIWRNATREGHVNMSGRLR